MSHYRERRDKIKNLQSKSLDHLASGVASKPSLDVPQPGPLEQSQSHKRLRESSPKWKEHYSKLSQQWTSGVSLAQQESNVVWEDVRQRKEKGGYPWTHLSHHQDEEVWLNPQKLPQDIGRLLSYSSMAIMSHSIQKCILDIPDEILEDNLFSLLSFDDLIRLMNIGNARLFHCCDAVIIKKPFDLKKEWFDNAQKGNLENMKYIEKIMKDKGMEEDMKEWRSERMNDMMDEMIYPDY